MKQAVSWALQRAELSAHEVLKCRGAKILAQSLRTVQEISIVFEDNVYINFASPPATDAVGQAIDNLLPSSVAGPHR
jgi:hypothetical protein